MKTLMEGWRKNICLSFRALSRVKWSRERSHGQLRRRSFGLRNTSFRGLINSMRGKAWLPTLQNWNTKKFSRLILPFHLWPQFQQCWKKLEFRNNMTCIRLIMQIFPKNHLIIRCLCNLPELQVVGGIQHPSLFQEALNKFNQSSLQ